MTKFSGIINYIRKRPLSSFYIFETESEENASTNSHNDMLPELFSDLFAMVMASTLNNLSKFLYTVPVNERYKNQIHLPIFIRTGLAGPYHEHHKSNIKVRLFKVDLIV